MLDLIHICRLVSTSDQAYPRGINCNLDYGVGATNRSAVMGEQCQQKRAQHAALWHAAVKGDTGGGEDIYT